MAWGSRIHGAITRRLRELITHRKVVTLNVFDEQSTKVPRYSHEGKLIYSGRGYFLVPNEGGERIKIDVRSVTAIQGQVINIDASYLTSHVEGASAR